MARFTFKLEAVLEQLAAVSRTSAAELRSGRLSAAALAAHQRFILSIRHKSAALKGGLGGAERDLHDAQAALTEAAKQRKVMEKLREREHAKWAEQQRRRDAQEADDVAQQIQLAERAAQFDVRI
jgi:flagellar export protein FliJ